MRAPTNCWAAPGPYSDPYEESKARALKWLRKEGLRRFPVIVMFPGVLYGPGPKTEGNLVGGMIDQFLAGKFPGILGSGQQRWSFAFVADVVKGHLAALGKGKVGEEYLLAGDNRSLNEFFRVLANCAHIQRSVRHLPFRVGKFLGAMELARARVFGHSPQLTPAIVERSDSFSRHRVCREKSQRPRENAAFFLVPAQPAERALVSLAVTVFN